MQKYLRLFKSSGYAKVPCYKALSLGYVLDQVNEVDWEGDVSQQELVRAMDAAEVIIEGNGVIRDVTHTAIRQYDKNGDFTEISVIETKKVVIHLFKIEQEWMFSIPGSELKYPQGGHAWWVRKSDMPSL